MLKFGGKENTRAIVTSTSCYYLNTTSTERPDVGLNAVPTTTRGNVVESSTVGQLTGLVRLGGDQAVEEHSEGERTVLYLFITSSKPRAAVSLGARGGVDVGTATVRTIDPHKLSSQITNVPHNISIRWKELCTIVVV